MSLINLSKRYGTENFGIYFSENEDPLDLATFGAFVSRNCAPFEDNVAKVNASAKQRVIEQFYVNYGHRSIGDLVDVKMFFEGIPIWLAFMLEAHSRFRGQESSTRYIDFSNAKNIPFYADRQEEWDKQIALYSYAKEVVIGGIEAAQRDKIPLAADSALAARRAISARAFDITRGLLPSYAPTNMVWYGSINEIRDHLAVVKQNLMDENSTLAEVFIEPIIAALDEQYPETKPNHETIPRYDNVWFSGEQIKSFSTFSDRLLDFGSCRDLNRHRPGYHSHDLYHHVSQGHNSMHPWYVSTLTVHHVDISSVKVEKLHNGVPNILGGCVYHYYECSKEQYAYVSKLRTKTNVHPILREFIIENLPTYADTYSGIPEGVDESPDVGPFGFYMQRGNETIEMK